MMNTPERHENEYIQKYAEKGYNENFRVQNGKLIGSDSSKQYNPSEVAIVAEHRFEGMTNPADLSILYVLETSDGQKGSVLTAYGPNADIEVAEFFQDIPEDRISHSAQVEF